MKILIDIGHPAHVHLFSKAAAAFLENGSEVLFTLREKSFSSYLLDYYHFPHVEYGKTRINILGKLSGLPQFVAALHRIVKEFKPDITISHSSFYLSQVCFYHNIPNITLEDTGNNEQVYLYWPFTNYILTANVFHKNYGSKQIKYNSYHELAYLHPNQFEPDTSVSPQHAHLKKPVVLIRFLAWSASHDIGEKGFSLSAKEDLVNSLSRFCSVFISSEDQLPSSLEKYKINIDTEKIHSFMSEADLYIGEGATMASECAVLGVPAIYVNSMEAGTIDDQEKYGLLFHFRSPKGVLEKAIEILNLPDRKQIFQERRKKMLSEKIDLTAFMVWFIENYPESAKIMKENPEYQYRFK